MNDVKKPIFDQTVQRFVDVLEQKGGIPLYQLSPQQARNVLNEIQAITVPLMSADMQDIIIPGKEISVRIVRPAGNTASLPIILYMHGGGWVMGNKETHDRLVRQLAQGAQAAVVFVNYTLAPEGQYPTAHEQGYEVAQWIKEHGRSLNLDSSRMAIAGDSVGGLLATAIVLMAQERGGPHFDMQVLFYPVTNASFDTASYNQFAQGPWLTKPAMMWFWDNYVPDKAMRNNPLVSPLQASLEQLALMPPTFLMINECDVLRDEGETYAHKLMQAGVSVVAVCGLGMIHDCLMLNPLAQVPLVRSIIDQASNMLRNVFARKA